MPLPLKPRRSNLNSAISVLGHVPLLSSAEIFSFYNLKENQVSYLADSQILRFEAAASPDDLKKLGGSVKLGVEFAREVQTSDLVESCLKELPKQNKKVTFGVSVYGHGPAADRSKLAEVLGKNLKAKLKELGQSVRFVSNQREPALSSASVTHNKLIAPENTEFLVVEDKGLYNIAKTIAVQPFEDFSKRDFGRPGRDDFSGMLPPKLALMMLNLAGAKKDDLILDPFCGSGTILTESLQQGFFNLIGCDLSDKAIDDTRHNLAWTAENILNTSVPTGIKLFQADARDLARKISKNSINKIVTEPFLGPPLKGRESSKQIQDIISELKELYTSALSQFVEVLAPESTVVMVVPRWFNNGKWQTLSPLLPFANKKFGLQPEQLLPFSLNPQPFVLYHRPGQLVGREIWRLRKM